MINLFNKSNLIFLSIWKIFIIFVILIIGEILAYFIDSALNLSISTEYGFLLDIYFTFIINLILAIAFFRKNLKKIFAYSSKDALKGGLLGFFLVSLMFFILNFFVHYKIVLNNMNLHKIALLILILSMLFIAALFEEFIIRGVLLEFFISRNKFYIGLIVSSVIWALLHIENNHFNLIAFLNIFLFGIFLGLIYYKKRNITFTLFFHFLWNFSLSSIYGQSVSGFIGWQSIFKLEDSKKVNILINGNGFGIEASLVLTIILLIIIYFQTLNHRQNRKNTVI